MKRSEIVVEGERVARPIKQSSGWAMQTAEESGILFVLDVHESGQGGHFVREEILRLLLEQLDERKAARDDSSD